MNLRWFFLCRLCIDTTMSRSTCRIVPWIFRQSILLSINNSTIHLSQLIKYIKYWLCVGTSKVRSTHFHCCSKSYGLLTILIGFTMSSVSMVGDWNHLSPHGLIFSHIIQFFLIYQCVEISRCYCYTVQFEDVSVFIEASNEEKVLAFFDMLKLMVNGQ